MTPYPTEFPLDELKTVIAIVQSKQVTVKASDFAHAAWVVVGYGLSKIAGGGPLVAGALPEGYSDETIIELMSTLVVDNPNVVQAIPPVVWKSLIEALLKILAGTL